MSNHGLTVYNSNNHLQIGEDSRYLCHYSSGTVTAQYLVYTSAPRYTTGYYLVFDGNFVSGNYQVHLRNITSGVYITDNAYYIPAQNKTYYMVSAASDWSYIITSTNAVTNTGGYGLKIFDSGGNVIFNTNDRIITITDILNINITSSTPNSLTTDYTINTSPYAGAVPYVMLCAEPSVVPIKISSTSFKSYATSWTFVNNNTFRFKITYYTTINNYTPANEMQTSINAVIPFGVLR